MTSPGAPRARAGGAGWLNRAGVVLVGGCGALSALLEALLVPVYVGRFPFPVAAVLAVVGNALLPRLAGALVPRVAAMAVPFLAWAVVIVWFGVLLRPEGDVILPGGPLQWVTYGVLLGGILAGVVSIATGAPTGVPAAPRRR